MANEEQLAILKQGVETWNEWREKNPDAKIDLMNKNFRAADLHTADLHAADFLVATLSDANLRSANLREANLSQTDLRKADLRWANLILADLTDANLEGANLEGADLLEADLRGANIQEANLQGANLRSADLRMANLSKADVGDCIFGNSILGQVDLSNAKGLETVKHKYHSTIGIDTIYKSKGNIPEVFLRGCGVPENFITFMHSLAGQAKAFDFYSCFISYSSKDEDLAKRLYNDLQGQGVRCWFAPEDLKIGDKFLDRIEEAIRVYDKLMLLLSNHSINSAWVRKEVRTALGKEKQNNRMVLFPIRLDDEFMDTTEDWADEIRRTRHTGDFRNWKDHDSYQKAFERLLRDLQADSKKE